MLSGLTIFRAAIAAIIDPGEKRMSKIAIITDSTAYIPQELIVKNDIKVAPQISIWDGGKETFLDGVDMMPTEFYARLKESKELPTTSQATVSYFQEMFEPFVAEGKPIIAILISEELSGTLQSATQAKEMFPDAKIELVDSRSTAMELGFQVLATARAAEDGKPFEEIVALAQDAKNYTGIFFVVDTLEYLHRGGRIGGASRLIGSALNMKPLLHVSGGRVESFEKVRTKKKAITRMLDVIEERVQGKPNLRIAALHAAVEEEALELLEAAKKQLNPIEALVTEVSPVIGTHVGPGTVGIAFSTDI
jgi:DegV family protein with EDD domain